jgi:hypothetical protein
MAVRGNSGADRTSRWEVLLTNLKPSLQEMPHVADDLKALEELLPQARVLETQQADLRSQARTARSQLQEMLRKGDKIRSRLGATLKGKFGFSDEALVKYGFKPRPTARRRKGGTPQTPPQTGDPGTPTAATHGSTPTAPAASAK